MCQLVLLEEGPDAIWGSGWQEREIFQGVVRSPAPCSEVFAPRLGLLADIRSAPECPARDP